MTVFRNHYELLGIASSADGEAIRKAFCKLSKELHPDTTSLPQDEASQKFQQVCEAYELLADPILRRSYDLSLCKQDSQEKIIRSSISIENLGRKNNLKRNRRPLSGGELFSLFLLGIALLISLVLGIGFGITQGRELMIRPTWLIINQSMCTVNRRRFCDDFITSKYNSFKPTFFTSY